MPSGCFRRVIRYGFLSSAIAGIAVWHLLQDRSESVFLGGGGVAEVVTASPAAASPVRHVETRASTVSTLRDSESERANARTSFFGVDWNTPQELSEWLIKQESHYGGHVRRVPCGDSDVDKPDEHFRGKGYCSGGERMRGGTHNYAICYALVIGTFRHRWEAHLRADKTRHFDAAEIGVLLGSGVAIWSDLFSHATIHAFDRFRANILNNTPFLLSQGAFQNGMYELHGFDQGAHEHEEADQVVQQMNNKFFWIIDDASHRVDFTTDTFRYFRRVLDREGVYIYEDAQWRDEKHLRKGIGGRYDVWQCNHDREFYAITHLSDYPIAKAGLLWNASFRHVPQTVLGRRDTDTSRALPVSGRFLGVQWNDTGQLSRWLVAQEVHYGGAVVHVPCNKSEVELPAEVFKGPKLCNGGNRMLKRRTGRTAECYATLIASFVNIWEETWRGSAGKLEAVEIGSLLGSGVAIWGDLFAGATIHALDRHYSLLEENTPTLLELGAFRNGMYQLHGFDQGAKSHPETDAMLDELARREAKFFWIVDDASRLREHTVSTFRYFHEHLDMNGVYILEELSQVVVEDIQNSTAGRYSVLQCTSDDRFFVFVHNTTSTSQAVALMRKGNFVDFPPGLCAIQSGVIAPAPHLPWRDSLQSMIGTRPHKGRNKRRS